MLVTLFIKSLKLVKDLKLQGEKNTTYIYMYYIPSSKNNLFWLKGQGKSSTE